MAEQTDPGRLAASKPAVMRAARVTGPDDMGFTEVPVGTPGPGEVLVRMRYGSICGSDLHMVYDGINVPANVGIPGWPGHEGVGTVVEGDLSGALPGVVTGGEVLTVPVGAGGGCFADYQVIPATQLLPLPAGDPKALLMAQQLGTVVWSLKNYLPNPTPIPETVVILGAGSAGLFFVQLLKRRGVTTVVVSEPNDTRRELAATLGADVVVSPEEVLDTVADLTGGQGAELVIEAAGFAATRKQAVTMASYGGRVGGFGYAESIDTEPFPVWDAFRKSLKVYFVVGAQVEPERASFAEALRLIDDGSVDVGYCIDAVYPLDEIGAAFDDARAQRVVKAVVALE